MKCQKYWPNDSDGEQVYGDIKVGNLDEMELADYVIRRFSVTKVCCVVLGIGWSAY